MEAVIQSLPLPRRTRFLVPAITTIRTIATAVLSLMLNLLLRRSLEQYPRVKESSQPQNGSHLQEIGWPVSTVPEAPGRFATCQEVRRKCHRNHRPPVPSPTWLTLILRCYLITSAGNCCSSDRSRKHSNSQIPTPSAPNRHLRDLIDPCLT
jgi:hypothetical protein